MASSTPCSCCGSEDDVTGASCSTSSGDVSLSRAIAVSLVVGLTAVLLLRVDFIVVVYFGCIVLLLLGVRVMVDEHL